MSISILFVDDDVNLLESLTRLFRIERDDIIFDTVTSAEDALKYLEQKRYDVIVSDHLMAGMGGLSLLALLKEKYPEMKRVMLSAQISEEIFRIAGTVAHKYISKPCEFKMLISEIEELLNAPGG